MNRLLMLILSDKKTSKELFWSFFTKGGTLGLFLFVNIVLARFLGSEDFGLWSLFLSVITIVFTLSYFGINASTRKFVAQHNKTSNLKDVLLSSIKLRLIFSLVFSIFFFFLRGEIAKALGNSQLEILFLYGTPLIFFAGFAEYFKSVFMGLHRIKYNFVINLVEHGLKLFLVVFFFLFANSLIFVVNSYVIALCVTCLVGFYILYFNFYKNLEFSQKDFKKEIFKYSIPLILVSLGFIVLTEIDTVMIGIFSTSEEVGIYAVAKQIIIKLPHIALAISMGTMPVFAKLNSENKRELREKFYNILKINSGIYFVIVVGILFLSPFVLPWVFGEEYIDSILPLQILTIYLFLAASSRIVSVALDYVGEAKIRAYNIIFTIILNVTLNMFLIPQYGATGAAIATSISYAPYFLLNYCKTVKILR